MFPCAGALRPSGFLPPAVREMLALRDEDAEGAARGAAAPLTWTEGAHRAAPEQGPRGPAGGGGDYGLESGETGGEAEVTGSGNPAKDHFAKTFYYALYPLTLLWLSMRHARTTAFTLMSWDPHDGGDAVNFGVCLIPCIHWVISRSEGFRFCQSAIHRRMLCIILRDSCKRDLRWPLSS